MNKLVYSALIACGMAAGLHAQQPQHVQLPAPALGWISPETPSPGTTNYAIAMTRDMRGIGADWTRPTDLTFLKKSADGPWKRPSSLFASVAIKTSVPRTPFTTPVIVGPADDTWPRAAGSRLIDLIVDETDMLTPISGISTTEVGYLETADLVDGIKTSVLLKPVFAVLNSGTLYGDTPSAIPGIGDVNNANPAVQGIKIKWYVHGVAVSDWLTSPFKFTLLQSNPALDSLCNGMHDIQVDVQDNGDSRNLYTYDPMYLHFYHAGRSTCTTVPMLTKTEIYNRYVGAYGDPPGRNFGYGSRVFYVDPATRNMSGHPAATGLLTHWSTSIDVTDLFQESMEPHTDWPLSDFYWWEIPSYYPDAGFVYAKGMTAKNEEEHPGLYTLLRHNVRHVTDGPRGVGFTSPYITGQIDDNNDLYFGDSAGNVREMHEDGSLETIVGWRTKSGHFPVWPSNHIADHYIREVQDFVGCITEGNWANADDHGLHTTLDVAIGPVEGEFYAVGFHDNAVYKIVEGAATGAESGCSGHAGEALVTVFAGSVDHTAGHADGTGHSVTFWGPTSIVYDPVSNGLYISDQENDLIRFCTMAAVCTTWAGEWQSGTHGPSYQRTVSDASMTGTVDVTSGQVTVVGTGTHFLTEMCEGGLIAITQSPAQGNFVMTITDDTHLTVKNLWTASHDDGAIIRPGLTSANVASVGADAKDYHRVAMCNAQHESGNLRYTVDSTAAAGGKRPEIGRPMTIRVGSDGDVYEFSLTFGSVRRINPSTWVTFETTFISQSTSCDGDCRGWAWFDIDRWGQSGPLDEIYAVASQASFFAEEPGISHPNEQYTYSTPDGLHKGKPIFVDNSACPNGWGPIACTDPPHYAWLVAVGRGQLMFAGFGETGMTRVRIKDAGDPVPAAGLGYHVGQLLFHQPCAPFDNQQYPSVDMAWGDNGHNYLGFNDLWAYAGVTISDNDLLAAFGFDATACEASDPGGGRVGILADFMRKNMGRVVSNSETPATIRIPIRIRTSATFVPHAKR